MSSSECADQGFEDSPYETVKIRKNSNPASDLVSWTKASHDLIDVKDIGDSQIIVFRNRAQAHQFLASCQKTDIGARNIVYPFVWEHRSVRFELRFPIQLDQLHRDKESMLLSDIQVMQDVERVSLESASVLKGLRTLNPIEPIGREVGDLPHMTAAPVLPVIHNWKVNVFRGVRRESVRDVIENRSQVVNVVAENEVHLFRLRDKRNEPDDKPPVRLGKALHAIRIAFSPSFKRCVPRLALLVRPSELLANVRKVLKAHDPIVSPAGALNDEIKAQKEKNKCTV